MSQEKSILLIDDEPTFLQSTAELLRQEGYACAEATGADEAHDKLEDGMHDLVVADIKMPGNANLELVETLAEQSPDLPVILVTGYPSTETAVDSVNLNVHAYLVKPFDFEELLEHVQAALQQRETARLLEQMQARARRRVRDFDKLSAEGKGHGTNEKSLIQPIFDLLFQDLADVYIDLRQLCTIIEADRPEALSVVLRNDPDKKQMAEALQHAIDVIEETKTSFKSKQLAQLRKELETTLKKTPYAQ